MPLSNFRSSLGRPSTASRSTGRRRRHRFAPDLLPLEARALLSTLTVTNDNDSGSGSLRYELGIAQPNDIIDFSPKAYGTITLTGGALPVATSVDIQGPGRTRSRSAATASRPSSKSRTACGHDLGPDDHRRLCPTCRTAAAADHQLRAR